jgi:hypothetical protein
VTAAPAWTSAHKYAHPASIATLDKAAERTGIQSLNVGVGLYCSECSRGNWAAVKIKAARAECGLVDEGWMRRSFISSGSTPRSRAVPLQSAWSLDVGNR